MTVTGIIAEYNPFHNGHAYHLQEARRLSGADFIIVVMGGNFMQRGEPAVADKFARAKMALLNGADLVLELPVPFATGSAEFFAYGAVSLLEGTGVVSRLCFGSESGDLSLLWKAASLLSSEPWPFRLRLKEGLKEGLSFPKAREQALLSCLSIPDRDFFAKPNNILGIEYLKALIKRGGAMVPLTVQRLGGYHDVSLEAPFASASAIRNSLLNHTVDFSKDLFRDVSQQMPPNAFEILFRELSQKGAPCAENLSMALYHKLLSLSSRQELFPYLDVSEDLARRIFSLRSKFAGYASFLDLIKTRQYTRARIARCLLHIILDIRKEDADAPKYLRVLGFQKKAAPLLTEIKKRGGLPLVTKVSAASKTLDADGLSALEKDLFASSFYHGLSPRGLPYSEFSRPLVLI